MTELIEAIKAWPVIIQGALGSALFSLVILISQWVWKRCASSYSHHSKSARISWLISQCIRYEACLAEPGVPTIEAMVWILYRASRSFIKALLWLVYGLIMNSLLPLAGVIGYAVCIWYLFRTFQIVGPIDNQGNAEDRLQVLQKELVTLKGAESI